MNQATFNDGRRIAKNPEVESFFTELHHARQPTIGRWWCPNLKRTERAEKKLRPRL